VAVQKIEKSRGRRTPPKTRKQGENTPAGWGDVAGKHQGGQQARSGEAGEGFNMKGQGRPDGRPGFRLPVKTVAFQVPGVKGVFAVGKTNDREGGVLGHRGLHSFLKALQAGVSVRQIGVKEAYFLGGHLRLVGRQHGEVVDPVYFQALKREISGDRLKPHLCRRDLYHDFSKSPGTYFLFRSSK